MESDAARGEELFVPGHRACRASGLVNADGVDSRSPWGGVDKTLIVVDGGPGSCPGMTQHELLLQPVKLAAVSRGVLPDRIQIAQIVEAFDHHQAE